MKNISDLGCRRRQSSSSSFKNQCNQQYSNNSTTTINNLSHVLNQNSSSNRKFLSSHKTFSPSSSSLHSLNKFKIILMVYLIFMLFNSANAVTFFYGTTGPEADDDKTLRPLGQLSYHEESLQGPIPDITDEDLSYVYHFCKILPRLEQIGKVRKSRVTRSTCERLIIVLTPMFKKSSNKSLL